MNRTEPVHGAIPPTGLQRSLQRRHFLTLGVGATFGVAWAILLGQWLASASPIGAISGMLLGGLLVLPIAGCYAEVAAAMPAAGGELVLIRQVFGRPAAFAMGWFLVLMAIAVASFEAISLGWFLEQLFPGTQGRIVYTLLGASVRIGGLTIGITITVLISLINYLGARSIGPFQNLFTYLKAAAVLTFVVAAVVHGRSSNLHPLWADLSSRPSFVGLLWIAATAPAWYSGFQIVAQGIEERGLRISRRTVGYMIVLTVCAGILFYCGVIAAAVYVVPWRSLITAPLPAAVAIEAAVGKGFWSSLILALIILGILATQNACLFWGSRLLLALGRMHLLPHWFARVGRFGSPGAAVLFAGCGTLLGLLLGRGALIPIINMAAISLAFSYALVCLLALRLRRDATAMRRPFRMPFRLSAIRFAICTASAMAFITLLEPLTRSRSFPLEWGLMIGWAALGVVCVALIGRVNALVN